MNCFRKHFPSFWSLRNNYLVTIDQTLSRLTSSYQLITFFNHYLFLLIILFPDEHPLPGERAGAPEVPVRGPGHLLH